jgi:S-adenosylmethionine synthetase
MTDNRITLEELEWMPLEQQRIELVERKGKGHPDSICDAGAEAVSRPCAGNIKESTQRVRYKMLPGMW